MKKILSLALATVLLSSALASCAAVPTASVTLASSDAAVYADWLTERLGYAPEGVVLGIGSSAEYGVDMTDFESDGYVLRTVGDTTVAFGKTKDGLDRAVREYAKAAETGITSDLNTVFHEGCRIKNLTIAGRDISEYTIYYPADANENMKFAASELIRLVKKACGAELTAIEGEAEGLAIEFKFSDDKSLKDDGFTYTVTESGIVFEGAVKRGAMYAVWRFLQNECGWDSLVYGDSYLNEAEHVDVPAGTALTEIPVMDLISLYSPWNTFISDIKSPNSVQNSYGSVTHACHGILAFLDPGDASRDQICYNDEDTYEMIRDRVEDHIISKINAGYTLGVNFFEIDIAQTDSSTYCLCDTCLTVLREENNAHSGSVVRFANRLSEELNETYPGIVYKIFAYANSNKPCVTVPNELIYITYCTDGCCTNHKFDGSVCTDGVGGYNTGVNGRNNKDYSEWLEGWLELTPNVYVWHYTLGTCLQQYTVLDNIYDDMRYFEEIGVRGLFLESENYGNFGVKRIEHQLWAEMNWNNDMTEAEYEEMLCTLLEREFGDGWKAIREYVTILNTAQDLAGCWQCWGWTLPGCWDYRYDTHYFAKQYDALLELVESALPLANTAKQEDMLIRLKCVVLYMGCYSSYYTEYLEGDTDRIAVLEERYALCMELLGKLGINIERIPVLGHDDAGCTAYSPTLYEAAWKDWVRHYEEITGLPLPEDAPVIKP